MQPQIASECTSWTFTMTACCSIVMYSVIVINSEVWNQYPWVSGKVGRRHHYWHSLSSSWLWLANPKMSIVHALALANTCLRGWQLFCNLAAATQNSGLCAGTCFFWSIMHVRTSANSRPCKDVTRLSHCFLRAYTSRESTSSFHITYMHCAWLWRYLYNQRKTLLNDSQAHWTPESGWHKYTSLVWY